MAAPMSQLPDSNDPGDWLRAVAELEDEIRRAVEWAISVELDGEAATIGRALDEAMGIPSPIFLELGDGRVLEGTIQDHQKETDE